LVFISFIFYVICLFFLTASHLLTILLPTPFQRPARKAARKTAHKVAHEVALMVALMPELGGLNQSCPKPPTLASQDGPKAFFSVPGAARPGGAA
jgi:hypothetical protein